MDRNELVPGWIGALAIAVFVWMWDDNAHVLPNVPRESITGFHWRHPYFTLGVWTLLWSHMVRQRPRKVLIWF